MSLCTHHNNTSRFIIRGIAKVTYIQGGSKSSRSLLSTDTDSLPYKNLATKDNMHHAVYVTGFEITRLPRTITNI